MITLILLSVNKGVVMNNFKNLLFKIYIVDCDNNTILNANNIAINHALENDYDIVGVACQKVFDNHYDMYKKCILNNSKNNTKMSCISQGGVDLLVQKIKWHDYDNVYIVIINENNINKISEEFLNILSSSDKYIASVFINLSTKFYNVLSHSLESEIIPFDLNGDYEDLAKQLHSILHPDHIYFAQIFHKLSLNNKNQTIKLQVQNKNGQYHWILLEFISFPSGSISSDEISLLFIKNIDDLSGLEEISATERERLIYCLISSFDIVLDINITKNKFNTIKFFDTIKSDLSLKTYDEYINMFCDNYIFIDDKNLFKERFNRNSILNTYISGQNSIDFECRIKNVNNDYNWTLVTAVPFLNKFNNDIDSFIFFENIDTKKRKVMNERYRDAMFMLMFSNEYEYAYEIDVVTDKYNITYLKENNKDEPISGIFSEHFDDLIDSSVDIEFQEDFARLFNVENMLKQFEAGKSNISFDFAGKNNEQTNCWKNVTARIYVNNETNHEIILLVIKDITELKNSQILSSQNEILEKELKYSKTISARDERFRIIVRQTGAGVFEWTLDSGIVYMAENISNNYDMRSSPEMFFAHLVYEDDLHIYKLFKKKILLQEPTAELTCRILNKKGEYHWTNIIINNFYDTNNKLVRIVGTLQDVHKQTTAYNDLKYRADHDNLTGLYNKDKLYSVAQQRLKTNTSSKYAFIIFDLDKFRIINDVFGSSTGDKFLNYVANTLQTNMPEDAICGRLYSDNFGIFMNYNNDNDIINFMDSITKKIRKYPIDIKISISYGVYKIEDIQLTMNTICDWANFAKKRIKGNALKSGAFYDDTLRHNMLEEQALENDMERSLQNDEFKVYLQPKFNIETSEVIGAEALTRWIHPVRGLIPPDRFIPLFERNNFIINMDKYIWEQVCKLIRKWLDLGLKVVPISLNVSRLHIVDPKLPSIINDLIMKYNIPSSLIEIEITETAFFENITDINNSIKKLKEFGFAVSMDDFGSGYSSLNMLKELHVDILKIDRNFMNEVVATEKGKTVIRHTISMATDLNLEIISEGVETEEQAKFLLQNGCNTAQGFFYSKPLAIDNYETFVYGQELE